VERLHEAHGGTARPVEAAGRGGLKVEGEVAEGDRPHAAIGEHTDTRWNGVGESEVVGGGEAIDHHPDFALAGQRVDHVARVGVSGLSGEPVVLGGVVETARYPPQAPGSNEPVEGLIDRSARSKVGEVLRGPDARLRGSGDPIPDGGWNAGAGADMGGLMSDKCNDFLTSTAYPDVRTM